MKITRRQFLLLTAGLASGCTAVNDADMPATAVERTINVGLATDYAQDGVYTNFRDLGFFVIRQGDKLFALSAICTHRKCKLTAEADRSFYCKCHGSTFDPAGRVTNGPARRDLPKLSSHADAAGRWFVTVPAGSV